jgi:hypothetical protein
MASGSSDHAHRTIVTDSKSGQVDHRHINPYLSDITTA